MQVIATVDELRRIRNKARGSVGLVPTMGALHDGHVALVRASRARTDITVTTIFVNPTQFGPDEDLESYPRTLDKDLELLEAEGVDIVYMPSPALMYPEQYQTYILVENVTARLEGEHRPGHFRGVATVVAKLFNQVQPHEAFFGQKDAQQVVVIRRMVADLNFPVDIVVIPTVRVTDGLAMSSRNVYLSRDERKAASVLYRALQAASAQYDAGERRAQALRDAMRTVLRHEPLAQIDYVSAADVQTLEELEGVTTGPVLLSLAVQIGKPRLLDNMLLPGELNTQDGLTATLGVS